MKYTHMNLLGGERSLKMRIEFTLTASDLRSYLTAYLIDHDHEPSAAQLEKFIRAEINSAGQSCDYLGGRDIEDVMAVAHRAATLLEELFGESTKYHGGG
jgi:hypothetical protein